MKVKICLIVGMGFVFALTGCSGQLSAQGGGLASDSEVAPMSSCPQPSGTFNHVYYSDPVNGSMSGDGSQSHPWGSLAAIIQAGLLPPGANAVVRPGDSIELMSGNHGDVTLSATNSDFITIEAASGQSPVLSTLTMYSGDHWVFKGLTFQHLNNGGYDHGATLDATNIVFTQNTITSQSDVSSWTQADWQQKGLYQAISAGGNCLSITNNKISNIRFGIGVSGTNILVQGNTIDHFTDDGIDFGQGTGSGTIANIVLSQNTITNNMDIGDGNHNDGIQGWVLNGTVGKNVTIDRNTVIAKLDPNLPMAGMMQGISEFDGAWDGIQITNNVVMASLYHGISLYGAQNSSIINNTVYGSFVASNGDVNDTWIGVFDNKDGTHPNNVVVRNNVSSVFSLSNVGVTQDHNVTSANPQNLFMAFDRTTCSYNFHPAVGSSLLGAGSSSMAPSWDITGMTRTPPITIGAYQN